MKIKEIRYFHSVVCYSIGFPVASRGPRVGSCSFSFTFHRIFMGISLISIEISTANQWKTMKITKINENCQKSMKIDEKQRKSMKIEDFCYFVIIFSNIWAGPTP